MEPKLLIFRVSLSPKNQLLLIYLYQLLLNNRNSAYCFNSNHLEFSLITFYNHANQASFDNENNYDRKLVIRLVA